MSFGIAYNVKSKVRVCTPELFHRAIDSQVVAEVCAQIKDALEAVRRGEMSPEDFETLKGNLKKALIIFTFHATFKNGKRKNDEAVPSGLSIYDLDHIPNPEGRWKEIETRKEELGIVLAHITPSSEGLRLVFIVPPGMSLEEAQAWMARELGVVESLSRVALEHVLEAAECTGGSLEQLGGSGLEAVGILNEGSQAPDLTGAVRIVVLTVLGLNQAQCFPHRVTAVGNNLLAQIGGNTDEVLHQFILTGERCQAQTLENVADRVAFLGLAQHAERIIDVTLTIADSAQQSGRKIILFQYFQNDFVPLGDHNRNHGIYLL